MTFVINFLYAALSANKQYLLLMAYMLNNRVQVCVAFSARSPKLAEILVYGIFKWTYAKVNTYSKTSDRNGTVSIIWKRLNK